MSVSLARELRAFHVETYGGGRTGPFDHSRRLVSTREEFRAALVHVPLAAHEEKSVVGAWSPVDCLTREEGATDRAHRAPYSYPLETQIGRHAVNVTGSSASTMLDIDKLPVAEWPALLAKLRAYSGEVWSTASYDPEKPTVSVRVHLHLDRELTSADEVTNVRQSLSDALGGVCDKQTFQAVTVFYLPATRGHHFVELLDGAEVVVDALAPPKPSSRKRVPRAVPEGYTVSARDRALAAEELETLVERIKACTSGLRRYTTQATWSVGQHIAAGVLTEAAALEVLEEAVRYQNAAHGDERLDVEDRLDEVRVGLAEGIARGPMLPGERALPRELLEESLVEVIERVSADAAATRASELDGHILALPPGVGKSRGALLTIARSRQDAVVYSPSHALAEEHRATLEAFGVPADDIRHAMSPLHRPEGGEEACERSRVSRGDAWPVGEASPFAVAVRAAGVNLRATVCPRCPLKDTCPARFGVQSNARVTLAVHAAYEPVDEPGKVLTYLDEEPEPASLLTVSRKHLDALAGHYPAYAHLTGAAHATWTPSQVAAETARYVREAELADEVPQAFDPGQGYYVRQAALALRAGRPVVEDVRAALAAYAGDVRLSAAVADVLANNPAGGFPVDASELAPIRAVLGIGSLPGARVPTGDRIEAVVESPARRDIRRGYATLLSATPTPLAYGDAPIYAPHVEDGCSGVVREVLYLPRSSTVAFRADPERGLEMTRALLFALGRDFSGQRVLVVTFKHLVGTAGEKIRSLFVGAEVCLRWFGAVAGSNLFQEDAVLEADVVVTLGDYYANRRWLFEHFAAEAGLEDDARDDAVEAAGRLQVRQELTQAHGRARDPRRTRPVAHVHVGTELPLGWEGRTRTPVNASDVRALRQMPLWLCLEAALTLHSATHVAKTLGVQRRSVERWRDRQLAIDVRHTAKLNELAGLS